MILMQTVRSVHHPSDPWLDGDCHVAMRSVRRLEREVRRAEQLMTLQRLVHGLQDVASTEIC